jgi:septal ring factor EnvC (AmiA/AmiB activator)
MICFGGFEPRSAIVAALAMSIALATTVSAQERPIHLAQAGKTDKTEKLETLQQRDQDLKAARDAQGKSIETEAALKRDIEQIGADRRKLNQDLIDTAGRIRKVETQVAATETRLKPLDENEQKIRKSLDGRHAVIGEVLAALQRIGHRPPPALIASPEDALQSVRTAMLLGAVLPEMRHEVEALANDLSGLLKVRKEIAAERDRLKGEVASLGNERTRMTALVDARQKQQAEREKALDAERARASELARQVDNLKDLIAKLEQGLDPATRAAREAARSDARPAMAALHDPGGRFRVIARASSNSG